jgi:uncharacterized phiE125 gp8 family phage protein
MYGGRDVSHEPLLERTVAPTSTIISLAEAKAHLNVDHADDDDYITALVAAADNHLDGPFGAVGIALLVQTWKLTTGAPNGRDGVRLPVLPLVAVTGVAYLDRDQIEQTASLSDFQWFSGDTFAYIEPKHDQRWPAMSAERDALRITFTAGEGCPEAIKHAAKLLVGHWYENREAVNVGQSINEYPLAVDALLSRHRRGWMSA